MTSSVNTGKRIEVDLDGYAGTAGFTEMPDGTASLAYPSSQTKLRAGQPVEVDGRRWLVEKAGRSEYLRGFVRVELRPVRVA